MLCDRFNWNGLTWCLIEMDSVQNICRVFNEFRVWKFWIFVAKVILKKKKTCWLRKVVVYFPRAWSTNKNSFMVNSCLSFNFPLRMWCSAHSNLITLSLKVKAGHSLLFSRIDTDKSLFFTMVWYHKNFFSQFFWVSRFTDP